MTVKVRFAPSPTGPLHIGGARSALFNYLFSCNKKGKFILRFEDTDLERSSRESEKNIIQALRWLGIEWNEGMDKGGENGPYRQTERLETYQKYTNKLLAEGNAYYCYCSEEELDQERQELLMKGETPRYMGKCRSLTEAQKQVFESQGRKPVVRFRVPEGQEITINDSVRGKVTFDSNGIGDYIIVKSDGIPTYNFAVVIDDVLMGITHVVRGEEHLSNTPRQVLIYEALNFDVPEFAHISLILNTEGHKMSKRDGDTAVIDYFQKGYLPEAMVNFIALLGWSPAGEKEFFTMEELKEEFSLQRVSKSPAVFDVNKLNYINSHYLKEADLERLGCLALPFLQEEGLFVQDLSSEDQNWIRIFLGAVREKISSLSEIKAYVQYFYGQIISEPDQEAASVLRGETVPQVLELFMEKITAAEKLDPSRAKGILKEIGKELNLKGKDIFMPIRISLTGKMHGPDLDAIIALLGKDSIQARLAKTKKYLLG
ncbi:glutamyl-tRNA synthetase [Syntrophobotulus glycolicus DSM 8271]|uniref:Glutamate--tRNA ligase n=1 Tax=Syntrophobotulus glycolicus (strain DSM 8271 / FlGlyR) TaxID=645991 RepID=F0SXC3_SYNGF|nr:glutamate--tRNA ligase [Syntrophobotulus glycolicus]ADY54669.1 glutamyl-tRNA synthetase [Syntrophobotulus glycolicus DSM 8271]